MEVESSGVQWTVGIIERKSGLISDEGGVQWSPVDCWAYWREMDLFQMKVESTGLQRTVSIIKERDGLIAGEGGVQWAVDIIGGKGGVITGG